MDFFSSLSFGLSKFGGDYAIMGIEASVIAYLYKKIMDSKDQQIEQARKENERNEKIRETLQRTTDNIFTFVQSHTRQNHSQSTSK